MDASTWDRVKDVIADALDRPASERDAYLDTHVGDPALLAEVRALIKDYEDAPDFLERLPVAAFAEDESLLQPGTQVGPYVVVRRLGGGGMGHVYLSHDDRLQRKVALKRLIRPPLDLSTERSRVLNEARAAARITHPNVAAVHDVIEHEGHIFIVMEFVEGESLAARLRREWMSLETALSIGRRLCSAVAAAHRQGIVHRDLKPANIQLTLDGSVKVLDFGIATASAPLTSRTTGTGTVARRFTLARGAAGTPEYMSPEQVHGRLVDHRSDIFSLGLVLLEMVTGRRAFADMDLVERRAAPDVSPPRADALDARVPRGVADVIARAVDADVATRFQSVAELERQLESLELELQQHAKPAPVSTPDDLVVSVRLKRWVLNSLKGLAVGLVVCGLAGLASAAAFNVTLQRPMSFAPESVGSYVLVGLRSNGMLIGTAVLVSVALFVIGLVVRLISLIGPLHRVRISAQQTLRRAATRLGLDDPALLGQILAAAGLIAVIALWWRFWPLISAFAQFVSAVPQETFQRLAPGIPENRREWLNYRLSVNVALLALGACLFVTYRLRARRPDRRGTAAFVLATGIFGLVVAMHVLPYRIMYQNEFERVTVSGERCYLLGQRSGPLASSGGGDTPGIEGLIYCPDVAPPRVRRINLQTTELQRSGEFESIFTSVK
jgi:serine/threonine protein kinase